MTDHEMLLLRAAVEATDGWLVIDRTDDPAGGWRAATDPASHYAYVGPTLADALTALLRGISAEAPAWPSEEGVAELRVKLRDHVINEAHLTLPAYLALRGGS